MVREINFDMDGTLANLYGVKGWLSMLETADETPYKVAEPLINMQSLARVLNRLQKCGWKLNVISWLAKNSTAEYDERVINAKIEWLSLHLKSVKWDKVVIVPHGTPKSTCGHGILFDDEKRNRDEWNGLAFDETEILKVLKNLGK